MTSRFFGLAVLLGASMACSLAPLMAQQAAEVPKAVEVPEAEKSVKTDEADPAVGGIGEIVAQKEAVTTFGGFTVVGSNQNQPPYHPMKAPPITSLKKQIPSSKGDEDFA